MNSQPLDLTSLGVSAPPKPDAPRDQLGQTDFLKLLTTQLQNQDPMKPMENGEFMGQMAQFSTVSGIGDLNNSFQGLAASLQSNQALEASSLVGRSVLAPAQSIAFDGANARGALDLQQPAQDVVLDITNAQGELVRRIEHGPQSPGLVHFEWDGRTATGAVAPSGEYQVSARASSDGQSVAVPMLIAGRVDSVTLNGPDGLTLNLSGRGAVDFDDVRQVS